MSSFSVTTQDHHQRPAIGFSPMLSSVVLFSPVTLSHRNAVIRMLAPLKYLTFVFASVYAYLIWQEIPDFQSTSSFIIIALAGLYTLHREVLPVRREKT